MTVIAVYLLAVFLSSFAAGVFTAHWLRDRRDPWRVWFLLFLLLGAFANLIGAAVKVESEKLKARIEQTREIERTITRR